MRSVWPRPTLCGNLTSSLGRACKACLHTGRSQTPGSLGFCYVLLVFCHLFLFGHIFVTAACLGSRSRHGFMPGKKEACSTIRQFAMTCPGLNSFVYNASAMRRRCAAWYNAFDPRLSLQTPGSSCQAASSCKEARPPSCAGQSDLAKWRLVRGAGPNISLSWNTPQIGSNAARQTDGRQSAASGLGHTRFVGLEVEGECVLPSAELQNRRKATNPLNTTLVPKHHLPNTLLA